MLNAISNLLFLADTAAPAAPGASGGLGALGGGMFLPMIIVIGIFYFMMLRPQQRKEKERRAMIDSVKSGDRILFSGGIFGTVTNAKNPHTLVVKVADNVKIEVARGAVAKVMDKGEKIGEVPEK